MSMVKRIIGRFPVFASKAKEGEVTTTHDKPVTNTTDNLYASYWEDLEAYLRGFFYSDLSTINKKSLNGIFKVLSSGISYLYQQGIPEHTINFPYPRGAVVTSNAEVYVSIIDNNLNSVTNGLAWKKLKEDTKDSLNELPVGTILTVPKNTNKAGYMDYVLNQEFDKVQYSRLYEALGTNKFNNTSTTESNLPIGTLIYSLDENIPEGWIEFSSYTSTLTNYPELKRILELMVNKLPLGELRALWQNALMANKLPNLEGNVFFLRSYDFQNPIGSYETDCSVIKGFNIPPVVIDESNTLNPQGYVKNGNFEQRDLIQSIDIKKGITDSSFILVGQHSSNYVSIDKKLKTVNLQKDANNLENKPKNLRAKLLIKATNNNSSLIPTTHKQIIKF